MARVTQAQQIAALTEQVATLANVVQALAQNAPTREVGVEVEAPAPKRSTRTRKSGAKSTKSTKSTKAREYRWRPWACARFGITPEVGSTFEYTSKRSGSTRTHTVTRVAGDEVFSVAK